MFNSKARGIIAAAALAVGLFGSAQAAQAGIIAPGTPADGARSTETQSDIIAILKADSAGNPQDPVLSMRKAGGDPE